MRKIVSILLTIALVSMGLAGCGANNQGAGTDASQESAVAADNAVHVDIPAQAAVLEFDGLADENLQRFIEDTVYLDLIDRLDSEEYFVENVEATYVSKEYLDELAYNTQANIYFGYTLAQLEDAFQGQKYIFTLGDDGHTTAKAFEEYDDTYDQVVRNVAIGGGVILVCVTVSAVTAGAGLPAASMIFAVSAKSGAIAALSGGAISGGTAALVTGLQGGNAEETLKAAALAGSEGFMIGAIGGAVAGGAGEAYALHGATLNNLTMNEAALIQRESKYPLDIIKQFHSMDEYQVYRNARLKTRLVSGKTALVKDIDPNFVATLRDGTKMTNRELMQNGYAPHYLDAAGKELSYQLHHIGQKADGTLAILTEAEHQGNSAILNIAGKASEIDRQVFKPVREAFWKSYVAGL